MSDDSVDTTAWWLIDYLEDELDPGLNRDLELLLECSEEDRTCFENIRLLKQWVGESDPAADFAVESRLDRLRVGVMDAVKRESAARPAVLDSRVLSLFADQPRPSSK